MLACEGSCDMVHVIRTALILLMSPFICMPAMAADLNWTNALDLTIEGRGWNDQTSGWSRLPDYADQMLPATLTWIGQQNAGMSIRFTSDSPSITVRWTLKGNVIQSRHMPSTGHSGMDLYVKDKTGWRWASCKGTSGMVNEETMIEFLDPYVTREYRLYLPLMNGVTECEIGIPDLGFEIEPVQEDVRKPIVFYGTSITQGMCASRPGNCHTSILGRRLDYPIVNLGFAGNGVMDWYVADIMGELNAAAFVIDCSPNMNGWMIDERAVMFVLRLRALQPNTPIILVEDRTYGDAWINDVHRLKNRQNRESLMRAALELKSLGVEHLHYIRGDELLRDPTETTVDAVHPTDFGFQQYADAFEPHLRAILGPGNAVIQKIMDTMIK